MTAAEAAALEQKVQANPDDVQSREKLIIFYDQAGKVSWEEKLAGIRRHALWRIAHLPETDLWIPNISKRYDPEGYAQAKQLWLEQTSKPDVTAKTLGRAAAFLSVYDKADAEELLLRAQQMEPGGPMGRAARRPVCARHRRCDRSPVWRDAKKQRRSRRSPAKPE